ncbi:MAG: hypothetical protein ACKORL_07110, partial [Phycisphaerales bacterium]
AQGVQRGVAAFASAVAGAPPEWADDDTLLAALGARAAAPPEGDAWHDAPLPLPVGNDAAALRISGAMLRTALAKAGIEAASLSVRALDAREFNRLAARVSNKATINFMAAAEHVERVRRLAAGRGVDAWIALDRQGGRTGYRDPLRTSFPDAALAVIEESEATARYRLRWPAGGGLPAHAATVSFELGGEERNLPIALASMAAKFARELHMRRLNAFFARHVPGLAPTAGYVQDGRRFLDDVGAAAKRLGIAREALVRSI